MRDCCHGISSADLLYNRFSDDTSCCPATCSVSREPCRRAQIHGSFPSSQLFKNKHIPINQSGSQNQLRWRESQHGSSSSHKEIRCKCISGCLSIHPQYHPLSMCDSDEVLFGSSVKNEAISCRGRGSSAGQPRLVGTWRPSLLPVCSTLALTGQSILIRGRSRHTALVLDSFLFTKMTTSSFHK